MADHRCDGVRHLPTGQQLRSGGPIGFSVVTFRCHQHGNRGPCDVLVGNRRYSAVASEQGEKPSNAAESITRKKSSANRPGLSIVCAMPRNSANILSMSQVWRVMSAGWLRCDVHWLIWTMASSFASRAAMAKATALWIT